jgi:peptidyl-prolyl cis-trans isomerase C
LDWGTPANFPKVFADAFTSLQKGQVTEKPVQTPSGFHVIKVEDTRPVKLPTLEEVKPRIADSLMRAKLQSYQESLVKKAKVQ